MTASRKSGRNKERASERDPDVVFDEWEKGKITFRASILDPDGKGKTNWEETGPARKLRLQRQAKFKAIRADLDLTQAEMAAALHIATKTLQGYEIGKPIPEPIFILAELIRDFPGVRKRLLAA